MMSEHTDFFGCQPKLMENFGRLLEMKDWAVDQTMIVTALESYELLLAKQLLEHADVPMDLTNVDLSQVVAWGIKQNEMELLKFLMSLGIPINYANILPLTGVSRIWCNHNDKPAIIARNAMVCLVLEHGAHDLGRFVDEPYQILHTVQFGVYGVAVILDTTVPTTASFSTPPSLRSLPRHPPTHTHTAHHH